jgi:hypothetical protein
MTLVIRKWKIAFEERILAVLLRPEVITSQGGINYRKFAPVRSNPDFSDKRGHT